MRCSNHPEIETGYTCVKCGKSICTTCLVSLKSGSYCRECLEEGAAASVPAHVQSTRNPETATGAERPVDGRAGARNTRGVVPPNGRRRGEKSPGLALLLSIIPGFGQFYNEDYAKGFLILGTVIVSIIMIVVTGLAIASSRVDILFDRYGNLPHDALDIIFERMLEDGTLWNLIPNPRHIATIILFSLLIPAIWIFGAIDAFITAKKTLVYSYGSSDVYRHSDRSVILTPEGASPEENGIRSGDGYDYTEPKNRIDATGIIGIILVAIGSLIFLNMFAPLWFDFDRLILPLLFIGAGAYLMRDTIAKLIRGIKGKGDEKK